MSITPPPNDAPGLIRAADVDHAQSTTTPTEEQRRAAALFYLKALNFDQAEWVKYDNDVNGAVDDDIKDLAALLAEREENARAQYAQSQASLLRDALRAASGQITDANARAEKAEAALADEREHVAALVVECVAAGAMEPASGPIDSIVSHIYSALRHLARTRGLLN